MAIDVIHSAVLFRCLFPARANSWSYDEAIGLAGRFQAATGIGEFDGFLAAAVGKGGYPRS